DPTELMRLEVRSQRNLHRAVSEGLAGAPISVEIQLLDWGQKREPHQAIYGQVCASDVASWMRDHGHRLFERNLRQFLGGSTVNEDIVATLLERPREFWYFNNGITAIATEIRKKPIGGDSTVSGVFECTGFSIVNGAQTAGSIDAAAAQNPVAVAEAMVPIRVLSTEKGADMFSSQVTRYTNTQNAIEKRDFVALDPVQERFRQELQIEGVEYVYKAGSGRGTSTKQFDLVEATVALACAYKEVTLAVQAKREIGRLWEDIQKAPYKQLFNDSVTGPAIWNAVQTLRAIELQLSGISKQQQGRNALICVHGNRFIQWGVMRLLEFEIGDKYDEVAESIKDTTKAVSSSVIAEVQSKYPESYPASLFKNLAKCRILADALPLST